TSPAIDRGVAILGPEVQYAGQGVFADIPAYPTVDFYGNPVDLGSGTPNLGACNAKNGEIATSLGDLAPEPTQTWLVYPQPARGMIHFVSPRPLTGKVTLALRNLKGELVQQDTLELATPQQEFELGLDASLANGIYVLSIGNGEEVHRRRMLLYR
ncbi:MAG: T9SS type A sorting domain-containing protein, partial [Bacteroidota bacterium]